MQILRFGGFRCGVETPGSDFTQLYLRKGGGGGGGKADFALAPPTLPETCALNPRLSAKAKSSGLGKPGL